MIKGIATRAVEISEEEFKQYQELVKAFGDKVFEDLFITNDQGVITIITPKAGVPMGVLYFVQNLSINQHLREQDRVVDVLMEKVTRLEQQVYRLTKDQEG